MFSRFVARYLCVSVLIAAPAFALDTTYSSSALPGDWYGGLSNFTVITFDGADGVATTNCSNVGGATCAYILQSGVKFYGFLGSSYGTNSDVQIVSESISYYNYGGSPASDPHILISQQSNPIGPIGFHIVLPTAVTAFGAQIMAYTAGYSVAVRLDGAAITDSGGSAAYPTGTVSTAGLGNRTFFGVTSTVPFQTIDMVSYPGDNNKIALDNVSFGNFNTSTAEPQSAIFLLTGLGMMLLAQRLKRSRLTQQINL